MRTICIATLLVLAAFVAVPNAAASPPTCEQLGGQTHHDLFGVVECVQDCLEDDVYYRLWPSNGPYVC